MIAGDHIYSSRICYTHHGIYIGNGKVIHYSGFADDMKSGDICITTLKEFGNGNTVKVLERPFRVFNHRESVERAYSRLGEDLYSLIFNNCEHFVNWCIDGIHESKQVNNAYKIATSFYHSDKKINPTAPPLPPSTVPSNIPMTTGGIATPSTVATSILGLATTAPTITTAVVAASLAKEVIDGVSDSNYSEISEFLSDAVDSTAEYIGETLEEVGDTIDSVVTGAIDLIDSLSDFFD